jgi:hypothetical protein
MLSEEILVVANIHLFTTAEGGRQAAIKTGYRPNHAFEKPISPNLLKAYIGEIRFDNPQQIFPGESAIVKVAFIDLPQIRNYLIQGQKWFLYEGSRLCGEGEIISI